MKTKTCFIIVTLILISWESFGYAASSSQDIEKLRKFLNNPSKITNSTELAHLSKLLILENDRWEIVETLREKITKYFEIPPKLKPFYLFIASEQKTLINTVPFQNFLVSCLDSKDEQPKTAALALLQHNPKLIFAHQNTVEPALIRLTTNTELSANSAHWLSNALNSAAKLAPKSKLNSELFLAGLKTPKLDLATLTQDLDLNSLENDLPSLKSKLSRYRFAQLQELIKERKKL